MVLDYCERRPVSKNRPKKQPVGMLVLLIVGGVVVSFLAGLATGWFFGWRAGRKAPEAAVAKQAVPAVPVPQTKPVGQDVPLTFYQTLPNGAKAVLGSGLNPSKANDGQAKTETRNSQEPKPAPATALSGQEAKPEPAADPKPAAKAQASDGGTFCVQVASLKDKKEAEAIKAKLLAKGLAAYIVESNVRDKGIWYRVRLGKHLKQAEAGELAAKAGKGAIAITE